MLYAETIGLVQLWPWPGLGGTWPWPWPWVELTGLGLNLGLEGWGLGLGTCGLINIPGSVRKLTLSPSSVRSLSGRTSISGVSAHARSTLLYLRDNNHILFFKSK